MKDLDKELAEAIGQYDLKRVRELMGKGADINALNEEGDTLFSEILEDHSFYVADLVNLNAKPGVGDTKGVTPLYNAVLSMNYKLARWLLENGAEVNAVSFKDVTPATDLDAILNSHHDLQSGSPGYTKVLEGLEELVASYGGKCYGHLHMADDRAEDRRPAKGSVRVLVRAYPHATRTRTVVYEEEDGRIAHYQGGSRSWRTNNPGNLAKGRFTTKHGAIGDDGVNAVFPDVQAGFAALAALLKGPSYRGKTISGAMARHAPAPDNDPAAYARFLLRKTGLTEDRTLASLTDAEFTKLLAAIQTYEGWKEGRVIK